MSVVLRSSLRLLHGCPLRSALHVRLAPLRVLDLRHTYAVDLVRAGVPITDVARMLGHKTLAVTLRYAHHAPNDVTHRARDLLEQRRRGDDGADVRESPPTYERASPKRVVAIPPRGTYGGTWLLRLAGSST